LIVDHTISILVYSLHYLVDLFRCQADPQLSHAVPELLLRHLTIPILIHISEDLLDGSSSSTHRRSKSVDDVSLPFWICGRFYCRDIASFVIGVRQCVDRLAASEPHVFKLVRKLPVGETSPEVGWLSQELVVNSFDLSICVLPVFDQGSQSS
jgi:hypothetical protein